MQGKVFILKVFSLLPGGFDLKCLKSNDVYECVERATDYLRKTVPQLRNGRILQVGVILGSGLNDVLGSYKGFEVSYSKIPYFPKPSVDGHKGILEFFYTIEGKTVAVMRGRYHPYEGYSSSEIAHPVRVLRSLGVSTMIITNAAGGLNKHFSLPSLMLISDHFPIGSHDKFLKDNYASKIPNSETFIPMSEAYSHSLLELAKKTANELNIRIHDGVYAARDGVTYETPAQCLWLLNSIKADAVGMSTIWEVVAAHQMIGGKRAKILGISTITNKIDPVTGINATNHEEVKKNAAQITESLDALLRKFIHNLP